ncbi:MAG: YqeG family HAD IIIA-type phosphatase [Fimbriimonadaceae bacterium]|nr:YqeG family HAD IIIA-type phosphatase [Fimbriimonadaceae bacterium]
MRQYLAPGRFCGSIFEITPALLAELGVRGVLLDVDNTLVPRKCYELPPEVRAWVGELQAAGICLAILSNSQHARRIARMLEPVNVPSICLARKPCRGGFRRALRQLDLRPDEAVMVGDQVLTDILGGNLAGLQTIYVEPLSRHDFVLYRLVRPWERRLLARWREHAG